MMHMKGFTTSKSYDIKKMTFFKSRQKERCSVYWGLDGSWQTIPCSWTVLL